jgi:hypothetical protein
MVALYRAGVVNSKVLGLAPGGGFEQGDQMSCENYITKRSQILFVKK